MHEQTDHAGFCEISGMCIIEAGNNTAKALHKKTKIKEKWHKHTKCS